MERFLLRQQVPQSTAEAKKLMKIYFLLMLISVFVAVSYIPIRTEAKPSAPVPPDSVPA
jgi:hypothetical protein